MDLGYTRPSSIYVDDCSKLPPTEVSDWDEQTIHKDNHDPNIKKIEEEIKEAGKVFSADNKERLRIHSKLQLPIAVLRLDSKAYKCLENRNNVQRSLKALLDDKRDPLRDLPADGVIHKLLRTQMHLKLEPEKDGDLWPLPA
jgi:hypothetical protein